MLNHSEYLTKWWSKKYNSIRFYNHQDTKGRVEMIINFLDYYKIKYKLELNSDYEDMITSLESILSNINAMYSRFYTIEHNLIRFSCYRVNGMFKQVLVQDAKGNVFKFKDINKAVTKYNAIIKRNKIIDLKEYYKGNLVCK